MHLSIEKHERMVSFAAFAGVDALHVTDDINIPHLATLSRLHLDTAALARARTDLANIIEMVDAMQAVPTDGVEPMAHPLDATQRLRADAVTEQVDVARNQAPAPETSDGYYLVPRVVE